MNFEIPESKITNYLLSGRTKSGFFLHFGYSLLEWTRLRHDILQMTKCYPLTFQRETEFGKKYAIYGDIKTPSGRMINLTTIWMIEPADPTKLKFLTAYPT